MVGGYGMTTGYVHMHSLRLWFAQPCLTPLLAIFTDKEEIGSEAKQG
jgi:aspartyl aminopeptidase